MELYVEIDPSCESHKYYTLHCSIPHNKYKKSKQITWRVLSFWFQNHEGYVYQWIYLRLRKFSTQKDPLMADWLGADSGKFVTLIKLNSSTRWHSILFSFLLSFYLFCFLISPQWPRIPPLFGFPESFALILLFLGEREMMSLGVRQKPHTIKKARVRFLFSFISYLLLKNKKDISCFIFEVSRDIYKYIIVQKIFINLYN